MNAGLKEFVPNWFRQGDHEMADNDIPPPPPQIAVIPKREPTEEEQRLKVIADAHTYVEQIKQERLADRKTIEQLQAEVGNLAHALQGERRKSGLLELDVAERDNNIATLQSELTEDRRLLDLLKDINDKASAAFNSLNIEGTKKERKPRAKNGKPKSKKVDNGQSTAQAAKAD